MNVASIQNRGRGEANHLSGWTATEEHRNGFRRDSDSGGASGKGAPVNRMRPFIAGLADSGNQKASASMSINGADPAMMVRNRALT